MCIIAIKPKGKKMFSDSQIAIMFANNPDGAGYMFYDSDIKKVVIRKGFMTYKSLLASLKSADFTNTNVVVHFRIGTSGLNDKLNCHPYAVFGANKLRDVVDIGMAHNGIMRDFEPPKGSKINDTQTFIHKVLNNLKPNFLSDSNVITMLDNMIGTNKLAFLDNKNKITTIGYFIDDDGYLFSNSSYRHLAYDYSCGHKSVYKSKPVSSSSTKSVYKPNYAWSNVCTNDDDGDSCDDYAHTGVYYDDYVNAHSHDSFWGWFDSLKNRG